MRDIYLKLFEVLFPVFFIVGIGYFLGKKNPNFDTSFITTYAGNFGTPALVIFALTAGGVTFEVFKEFFFYALILLSAFGIIGLIFLVLMKKDYVRELPTFFLPNTGNMGIPICLFAYGELGMGIAASISSLVVLLHFTLNIFLAKRAFDFQTIFKSPAFYAIIITVLLLYFEQPVPQFVMNTVMLLAYGMIVMILMSLGVALTQMKVFSFKDALIRGLAPDKGLYLPEKINKLPDDFINNIENYSNQEIAYECINQFVGQDIPEQDLRKIIDEVLSFDFPSSLLYI